MRATRGLLETRRSRGIMVLRLQQANANHPHPMQSVPSAMGKYVLTGFGVAATLGQPENLRARVHREEGSNERRRRVGNDWFHK
jgi:hypothetical protein